MIFDMGARNPRSKDRPLKFVPINTRIPPEMKGLLTIPEIVAKMYPAKGQ